MCNQREDEFPDLTVQVCKAELAEGAKLPARMTPGSAGFDLYSAETVCLKPGALYMVSTGLRLQIPPNLWAGIYSRSGLAVKNRIIVFNQPGVIDSDYRGEIKVPLMNFGDRGHYIHPGDRIAQLVFHNLENVRLEVGEIEGSKRGHGGFGSTGS